jgi:hypothetical protein
VESSANRIDIKETELKKKELEVQIIDERGEPINRHVDIKADLHKVLIIPKFQ